LATNKLATTADATKTANTKTISENRTKIKTLQTSRTEKATELTNLLTANNKLRAKDVEYDENRAKTTKEENDFLDSYDAASKVKKDA
jgi:hypothetical protein